ncbi:hypothetical protein [Novosphingobium aureum]|nr:hypothetical protein [Novosphingobium aureum]
MGDAVTMTAADREFAELADKGLSRAEIRERLDLSSGQYNCRQRRLAQLRRAAPC